MTSAFDPVHLRTGSLTLRPWADSDAPAVLEALGDPDIRLWNGSTMTDLDAAVDWVRNRGDWSAGDHASFAVEEARRWAGSVSLHLIDVEQGDAEIGYWLAPEARGRRIAARAVTAVYRWAFDALPIDRIELMHAVENVASSRVAQRAGFSYEGRLRQSYRYGDGVKHDELLWSRLASDPPTPD